MRISYEPLLPLDSFRKAIGYHPWHFWGCANASMPVNSKANTLIPQDTWQDADRLGRNQVLQAIIDAEQMLFEQLAYWPAPCDQIDTLPWPRLGDHALQRLWTADPIGQYVSMQLPAGYVQSIGNPTVTMQGSPAITYRDLDGDGIPENWIVTQQMPIGTDPATIAVYVSAPDRYDGSALGSMWRIQPITVVLDPGTFIATITGSTWLMIRPVLYQGIAVSPAGLDPTIAGNRLQTVDVAVNTVDPNGQTTSTCQATLIWETLPYPAYAFPFVNPPMALPNSADPAAIGLAIARCGIRNSITGEVAPGQALYSVTANQWTNVPWSTWREPDRVTIRSRAGYPLDPTYQMTATMQEIVVMLAAANLHGGLNNVQAANRRLYHWQFDLARTSGANDEAYAAISSGDLANPFGTRRGQVEAFKRVQSLRTLTGIAL